MKLSNIDLSKLKCVNINLYLPYLNKYCEIFEINTPQRILCFFSNLLHESGNFRYSEELASGDAYDTRVDLGNTPQKDGDGRKYKGRGLAQLTGKTNYRLFGEWLKKELQIDINFVNNPLKLKEPEYAVLSAFWFWSSNKLEKYADENNFRAVCGIWNTGKANSTKINGWNDRVDKYNKIFKLLKSYV